MENIVTSVNEQPNKYNPPLQKRQLIPKNLWANRIDKAEFGVQTTVSTQQAMEIVIERSLDKLRSVVTDAREALGIPEGAQLDTSPEATANRIADFALGAFDKWYSRHSELGEKEAREEFVKFIGGAISQGIEEARSILGALSALTPEVESNINATWEIIQGRLTDFVEQAE